MRISTGCTIFVCVLLFTCIVAVYADDTESVGNNTDNAALYSTPLVTGPYYGWGGSEVVLPGNQSTLVTGPYYGWGGSEVVLPKNQSTLVSGSYYGWGGATEIVLPVSEGSGWKSSENLMHTQAQPSSGTVMNGATWKSQSDLIRVQAGQGSTSTSHVYNETNDGETITGLVAGDVVTIRLNENPTTGFSWNATLSPGITLFNSTYIRDPVPAGYTGGGGTHVWTLLLKQSGTQTFHAVYKQPWMPASGDDITYDLTFNVKALGQY